MLFPLSLPVSGNPNVLSLKDQDIQQVNYIYAGQFVTVCLCIHPAAVTKFVHVKIQIYNIKDFSFNVILISLQFIINLVVYVGVGVCVWVCLVVTCYISTKSVLGILPGAC